MFQEEGITRKVKEKNGASGSCQWPDFGNHMKKKWEASLVGLNPEVAYGGNSSKSQTETYGQTIDISWFVNLFTRTFW